MEAWLITAVKDLASCLMSLWSKLAHDLAEYMLVPSEPNNRNMSAVKIAYQFNVRCDLFLWNAESKIVLQSCPLVLRTAFSIEELDELKKNWQRYTQAHINTVTHKDTPMHTLTHTLRLTDTHTHTHTRYHKHIHTQIQTPLFACTQTQTCTHSLSCNIQTHTHTRTHNTNTNTLQTHIDHHTAEFLKAMSNCVTVFSVDWLQAQQEVLKVKYWLRVGKQPNKPSKKDLNLLHTNHSVSGATTGYLLSNNNTFPGKPAVARCWPLLAYRCWQDEEDMELCSD